MSLRICAGSVMTAMIDILLPQLGQAITSSSWTLASRRARALRHVRASTSRYFEVSRATESADAVLPYHLTGAPRSLPCSSADYCSTSSTRRFFAFPSSVRLDAAGQ